MMKLLNSENHLDIYLNLSCNYRCKHCFVGEQLESKKNFEYKSLKKLILYAHSHGVKKVTFLGGEPTLYPHLTEAINYSFELGIPEIRIVSNGSKPLRKIIDYYSNKTLKPKIIFSLDSANQITHDKIRGKGSFNTLKASINLALERGFQIAGITSINKYNLKDVEITMDFAQSSKFMYLNFHHVSNRGFATDDILISPSEWNQVRNIVIKKSFEISYPIKFDRKFILKNEIEKIQKEYDDCFVNTETDGNVMIMPDGRVYKCALFIDDNKLNSHYWDGEKITLNTDYISESDLCSKKCSGVCPGLKIFSNQTYDEEEYFTLCMYRKETIMNGQTS